MVKDLQSLGLIKVVAAMSSRILASGKKLQTAPPTSDMVQFQLFEEGKLSLLVSTVFLFF